MVILQDSSDRLGRDVSVSSDIDVSSLAATFAWVATKQDGYLELLLPVFAELAMRAWYLLNTHFVRPALAGVRGT